MNRILGCTQLLIPDTVSFDKSEPSIPCDQKDKMAIASSHSQTDALASSHSQTDEFRSPQQQLAGKGV